MRTQDAQQQGRCKCRTASVPARVSPAATSTGSLKPLRCRASSDSSLCSAMLVVADIIFMCKLDLPSDAATKDNWTTQLGEPQYRDTAMQLTGAGTWR